MKVMDGDRAFNGVDERRDPGQLEAGLVANARNWVFPEGEAEVRSGFQAPRWAAASAFSFPFSFPFTFDAQRGHGVLYGSIPFSNREGARFFVFALANEAVKISESGTVTPLRYPLGVRLADKVRLIQAFNKVYLFRGEDYDPMVWNGLDADGFHYVKRDELPAGVQPMPRTDTAVYFQNRLYAVKERNEILFSDIADETHFELNNQFRIDSGSFDSITELLPFGQYGLVVFKENSLDMLDDLFGDLTQNAKRSRLSNVIGCSSPYTAVDVGQDVFFLSERGVYSVRQALDNELRVDSEPISAPIQPVVQRINWQAKSGFRAAYWDNKYILAVALDDSTLNNALLIYDFITRSWHGYHTADFLDAERLYATTIRGERRLFCVSSGGVLYELYLGREDDPLTGVQGIDAVLHTRGYGAQDLERKRFQRIELNISEWDPEYDIVVNTDGINEVQELALGVIRDRTRYHSWTDKRYELDNSNDDHGAPHREDYSVRLDPLTLNFPFSFPLAFRGTATPGGSYTLQLGSGVNPDAMQRIQTKRIVNRTGDYMQLQIHVYQGRLVMHGVRTFGVMRHGASVTRT